MLKWLTFESKEKYNIENNEVILYGKLNIYKVKGRLQFIVSNIHLEGEGSLWNKYLKLKNQLEKEGLFDIQHKKPLPKIPEKITIVSSKEGAVVHDILNILNRRSPYIDIIIENTLVQGPDAATNIIDALKRAHSNNSDLIILARGGGSIEDLMPFNDEKLIITKELFKDNFIKLSLGKKRHIKVNIS